MPTIRLQSSDKQDFTVPIDVAKESKTIQTMLENLQIENDEEEEIQETLPLPDIRGVILRKVLDWCEHYVGQPKSESEDYLRDGCLGMPKGKRIREYSEWEKEFINVGSKSVIYEIILAAKYLQIPGLFDMACMRIAMYFKGKTTEEMIKEFPELGRND